MLNWIFKASASLSISVSAVLSFAATVQAVDNFRYVSTNGSNANPCTQAQPCRSLQKAINSTPQGGEVRVIDSGWFGIKANIKRSITISGNGNTVALGGPIAVESSNATVVLRGLVLYGGDSTANGIRITEAETVHVERCVVYGFPGRGIRVEAPSNLFILDSIFRNNDNGGLSIFESGAVAVTIDNSRFENNQGPGLQIDGANIVVAINRSVLAGNSSSGIIATSGVRAIIKQVVATHNAGAGFATYSGSQLTIEASAAHDNNIGLFADANAHAQISNSTFVNNVYGINNNGGTVLTRGNNTVSGNTNANLVGTLTALGGN